MPSKSFLIASALEQKIRDEKLKAGDVLPSLSEMSSFYNSSQRVVREAVKMLEAKGLVKVAQGKKTIVCPSDLDSYLKGHPLDENVLQDIIDAHVELEVLAVRKLCQLPDRRDRLRQVSGCLNRVRTYTDSERREGLVEVSRIFHALLSDISTNSVLEIVANSIYARVERIYASADLTEDEVKSILNYFGEEVEAISHGDSEMAVSVLRVSMLSLKSYLLDDMRRNGI